MKKLLSTIVILGLGLLILSACGPLSLQVEPLATPTLPSPFLVTKVPTQAASPTLRAVTATPQGGAGATPQGGAGATPQGGAGATIQPGPTAGPQLHLKPGVAVRIVSLRMFSISSGWAVAETDADHIQRILTTTSGGQTWKDVTPNPVLAGAPAEGLAAAAFFAGGSEAWSVSTSRAPQPNQSQAAVWHTTDGGATWQKGPDLDLGSVPMEFQYPSDLAFLDDQTGWLVMHLGVGMSHDYIAVFMTGDGGKTWRRIVDPDQAPEVQSCTKSGVAFTSPSNGWITGNCPGLMPKLFLYHSTDGGATWAEASLPVPDGKPAGYYAQSNTGCGVSSIAFSAGKLAFVLYCNNYNNNSSMAWLYATTDGGTKWTQNPLPVASLKLDLLSPDEAFLVGSTSQDPNADGAVYHTTTGGASWAMTTSTAWQGLPDFIDSQNGWVVARHNQVTALVRSLDGGRTWAEIKPVIGN